MAKSFEKIEKLIQIFNQEVIGFYTYFSKITEFKEGMDLVSAIKELCDENERLKAQLKVNS
jgi:hypothetical protein